MCLQKDGTWADFVFVAVVNEGGHIHDIIIPEFHVDSYLKIPLRRRVENTLEFQIWLLAKQPDGMVDWSFALRVTFT